MQKIDKVVALVAEFFVDEEFSREEIAGVVREAYEVADVDFGAEEAARAAEDFEWPEEVLTRDSHKAERAGFSLERMVREEHDSKAHDRLSHARINSLLGSEGQGGGRRDGRENRDWERLHRLVDGARVLVDEDFAPNNRAPPLRSLYRRVSKAVHKLLLELWKEEKVFIVTKDVAAKLGALHYSPTHWARKAGKVLGRNIFDASDGKFSTLSTPRPSRPWCASATAISAIPPSTRSCGWSWTSLATSSRSWEKGSGGRTSACGRPICAVPSPCSTTTS